MDRHQNLSFFPKAALALLVVCLAGGAMAQEVKLFREGKFNESDLVDALAPEPLTRNIRLSGARPAAPAQGQAGSAAAPLLITFGTNSAELSPSARANLDIVGRALASDRLSDFRFSIEGHADPRGGPAVNQKLSQARAESVTAYLAGTHRISAQRLIPIGKGDSELLKPDTPASPENRRVTIKTLVQ